MASTSGESVPPPTTVLVQYNQLATIWGHGLFSINGGVKRGFPPSPVWGQAWARTRFLYFFVAYRGSGHGDPWVTMTARGTCHGLP